jgi:hypothetical protein
MASILTEADFVLVCKDLHPRIPIFPKPLQSPPTFNFGFAGGGRMEPTQPQTSRNNSPTFNLPTRGSGKGVAVARQKGVSA